MTCIEVAEVEISKKDWNLNFILSQPATSQHSTSTKSTTSRTNRCHIGILLPDLVSEVLSVVRSESTMGINLSAISGEIVPVSSIERLISSGKLVISETTINTSIDVRSTAHSQTAEGERYERKNHSPTPPIGLSPFRINNDSTIPFTDNFLARFKISCHSITYLTETHEKSVKIFIDIRGTVMYKIYINVYKCTEAKI